MTEGFSNYIIKIIEAASKEETVTGRRCFTCGGEPSTGQGEHVIPKWLQRRFGLYDEKITLLNGTLYPYRHLTVPCCIECNNGFLRGIEIELLSILQEQNWETLASKWALGRWSAKVLIGLLVKESSLLVNRERPNAGNIVPSKVLTHFFHAHLILQSARKPTSFEGLHTRHPFSLYTYRILDVETLSQFDLVTSIPGQSVAVRIGPIGFVFVNDGGLQHHVGSNGPFSLEGHLLHPEQFSEIAARIHYKATLLDATHSYVTAEEPDSLHITQTAVLPHTSVILADGSERVFRTWQDAECAQFIERYRRVNWGEVLDRDTGALTTILLDPNGEPKPAQKLAAATKLRR